jgi:hypothetical protein
MISQINYSIWSFFNWSFGRKSLSIQKSVIQDSPPCWNMLPDEIREYILLFVGDPIRTAKVNRDFRILSSRIYAVLFKRYENYPSLINLLSLADISLNPNVKVKKIYLAIIKKAQKSGIDLQGLEPMNPLSPLRLQHIKDTCLSTIKSKPFWNNKTRNHK